MCHFLILDLTGKGNSLDGNALQIFVSSCGIIFTLIELGCYLAIFHHLFTYDNGTIARCLGKERIRQRNRSHAITFLGQFCGFLTELSFMVIFTTILVVGESNTQLKALSTVMKFIEFGTLSMVEVIASKSLRNDFKETMFAIIERVFFSVVWF